MENAQSFVEKQEFIPDLKTRSAAERAIEIIGEASENVPDEVRSRFPEIPWDSRMRDRVVHVYFGVDYEILWNTVTKDIPLLLPEMRDSSDAGNPLTIEPGPAWPPCDQDLVTGGSR